MVSIELWAARLERSLTERETQLMMRILPLERKERLLRLKNEEKQKEALSAYLLLCLALRERCGWKTLPKMAWNTYGKPYFPDEPEVHFNLSHTSGAVLVGISDKPIGVDIEHVRPVSQRTMERLAKVQTAEEFFQSWVRREARAKWSGLGVGTMMRSETPLGLGEYYYELDTFPGYVAGVATRSHDIPLPVKKFILDEML